MVSQADPRGFKISPSGIDGRGLCHSQPGLGTSSPAAQSRRQCQAGFATLATLPGSPPPGRGGGWQRCPHATLWVSPSCEGEPTSALASLLMGREIFQT